MFTITLCSTELKRFSVPLTNGTETENDMQPKHKSTEFTHLHISCVAILQMMPLIRSTVSIKRIGLHGIKFSATLGDIQTAHGGSTSASKYPLT